MKRRIVLSFVLALATAPAALAQEGRGEGCECAPRFERERSGERRLERPPRWEDRGSVERLRRLRELRRARGDLERVLRRFDRDGDGRLGEAERRRIRGIREWGERRRQRMHWLRKRGECRRGGPDRGDGAGGVY